MQLIDFQMKLMEYFKSDSLKNAIISNNVQFSELELCRIIVVYVERFSDRLFLLNEMLSFISDVDMSAYVEYLIKEMTIELEKIKKTDTNCVFELIIKESPSSCEERYLCSSFDAALSCIDGFYEEYGNRENPLSNYVITKRRVLKCGDDFSEDLLGECTLNDKREICSVSFYETQNHYLSFCYKDFLCLSAIEIPFPEFVKFKDLVKYRTGDNSIKFGVCMNTVTDDKDDEYCLIIPLNCFALRYKNFDKAFQFHTHTEYWDIEKADVSDLSEEEAEIYNSYLKYVDEHYKVFYV